MARWPGGWVAGWLDGWWLGAGGWWLGKGKVNGSTIVRITFSKIGITVAD